MTSKTLACRFHYVANFRSSKHPYQQFRHQPNKKVCALDLKFKPISINI